MRYLIVISLSIFCLNALAQNAGSLDLSFDTDGKTFYDIGNDGTVVAAANQNDGSTLLLITSVVGWYNAASVVRLLPDGTPDPGFGTDGVFTAIVPEGSATYPNALAVQTDDKIVIGATIYDAGFLSYYSVLRILPDGGMDDLFGDAGVVMTPVAPEAFLGGMSGIALQNDGSIISFGSTEEGFNNQIVMYRLLSDGTIDDSFGDGTYAYQNPTPFNDFVYDMDFTDDNKIVFAGEGMRPTGGPLDPAYPDIFVVRLNEDGSPDMDFGDEGVFTADLDSLGDNATNILLNDDGTLYTIGFIADETPGDNSDGATDLLLCRFTANGQFDASFDDDGYRNLDLGQTNDYPCEILRDTQDKLVLTGFRQDLPDQPDFFALRLSEDLNPDPDFGNAGLATVDVFGSLDYAYAGLLTDDEKIVIAGMSNIDGVVKPTAIRLLGETLVGMNEMIAPNLNVYPNPVSDVLMVTNLAGGSPVRIYDAQGKLHWSGSYTQGGIDTSNFPAGVYLMISDDECMHRRPSSFIKSKN
ncbi:MAG: T9SS type A sorting domain-containing protein [Flavobacteriales bacterium]|nr:T9SS type A sorting domain-containing protein [Flavobacteriales bacterium]